MEYVQIYISIGQSYQVFIYKKGLEKGLNSLFLYQISNLNSEPHFNVIYEDKVINCIVGKDNFFYAAVVFLNFAKIKISTLTEKLRLDEFIAKIITD